MKWEDDETFRWERAMGRSRLRRVDGGHTKGDEAAHLRSSTRQGAERTEANLYAKQPSSTYSKGKRACRVPERVKNWLGLKGKLPMYE